LLFSTERLKGGREAQMKADGPTGAVATAKHASDQDSGNTQSAFIEKWRPANLRNASQNA